jgi:PAS domain S-box-containing protein
MLQEGLSKLDPQGKYLEVNEAYAELLGYTTKELIGKNWIDNIHEDDRDSALLLLQRIGDGETHIKTRLRGKRKSGHKFEQQVALIAPEEIKNGCYLFSIDVGHQVEARKELREISRGISELKSLFEEFLSKK